jgi:hypothetical protein
LLTKSRARRTSEGHFSPNAHDFALPLGHHLVTRPARVHRCPPGTQDRLLHHLPRHLPAKLLRRLAARLALLPIIHRVMRPRRRRPLPLVLPLLPPHAPSASCRAPRLPWRTRRAPARVRRDGHVLRDLRLAHSALPLLEPERQRQHASNIW